MGVDGPRRGAAVGGRRLSITTRWNRLLGLAEEPVSVAAPEPPDVVRLRLVPVRGLVVRPGDGGIRVYRPFDGIEAVVGVVPADGGGTEVMGLLRAQTWLRFFGYVFPLTLAGAVASAVGRVRSWRAGEASVWNVLVAAFVVYAVASLVLGARWRKRRLTRDLTRLVRGGR